MADVLIGALAAALLVGVFAAFVLGGTIGGVTAVALVLVSVVSRGCCEVHGERHTSIRR